MKKKEKLTIKGVKDLLGIKGADKNNMMAIHNNKPEDGPVQLESKIGPNDNKFCEYYNDKIILITGCTGNVG